MQITPDPNGKLWFIHKYETSLAWGGPEEGGWWFDLETNLALDDPEYMRPLIFNDEEEAFAKCRELHAAEYKRRDEGKMNYTSVLAYQHTFYCYDVSESQEPREPRRPHYE